MKPVQTELVKALYAACHPQHTRRTLTAKAIYLDTHTHIALLMECQNREPAATFQGVPIYVVRSADPYEHSKPHLHVHAE